MVRDNWISQIRSAKGRMNNAEEDLYCHDCVK